MIDNDFTQKTQADNEVNPTLLQTVKKLRILEPFAERSPDNVERGKAQYLKQANQLRASVSPDWKSRLNQWIKFKYIIFKGERNMSVLAPILALLMILFGGAGATALAAQNSLPDSALYPVKLLTEEIQNALTVREASRFQLQCELSNRRMEEFIALLQNKSIPSEALIDQWERHFRECTLIPLNQADSEMIRNLKQVQNIIQYQNRSMVRIYPEANNLKVMTMMQTQLREYERIFNFEGIDPAQIREILQERLREQSSLGEPPQGVPAVQEKIQNREQSGYPALNGTATTTPFGPAHNPWTTGTPTPGSGYGPGGTHTISPKSTSSPGSSNGLGGNPTSVILNTSVPVSSTQAKPAPTQPQSPTTSGGAKPGNPTHPPAPTGQPQTTAGPKGNGK